VYDATLRAPLEPAANLNPINPFHAATVFSHKPADHIRERLTLETSDIVEIFVIHPLLDSIEGRLDLVQIVGPAKLPFRPAHLVHDNGKRMTVHPGISPGLVSGFEGELLECLWHLTTE
jgi:hypothetical protein